MDKKLDISDRRVAKVKCTTEILTQLLIADPILRGFAKSNAPKDLKVIGIEQSFYDYLNGQFWVYFTSKENKSISDIDEIPTIEPFIITELRDVKTD